MSQGALTWRFPRMFWTGNAAELCERAAYYGTFIALRTYLIRVVGLDDVQAGVVAGPLFSGPIYLVPFFTGAISDRMGFRKSLILAFALLTLGYGTLGFFSTIAPVLVGLWLIVLGGAFVKPVITGTVSKSSNEATRARAFSIFYMVVNIGSFTGKTVVAPMRIQMGVETVPWFSAGASLLALILVALFYFPEKEGAAARTTTIKETLRGMLEAMSNMRFLALILITAGFWAIQGQLYASMPDYVLRMAGETYKPEWYANINPLVVVIFVVMITQAIKNWTPQKAITIAMLMIPLSSLAMASSAWFGGGLVNVFGLQMHPITLMMVIGIAIQGLAECFLSPKWLEFASKQAPEGKEGTFLGFAHMNVFFAWVFGFVFSGFLLRKYCPEPTTLSAEVQAQHTAALAGQGPMPEAYAQAHYLWYAYAGVGLVSLLALIVFRVVTKKLDEGKETPAA
jgi:dipeptide/tripeptide permease